MKFSFCLVPFFFYPQATRKKYEMETTTKTVVHTFSKYKNVNRRGGKGRRTNTTWSVSDVVRVRHGQGPTWSGSTLAYYVVSTYKYIYQMELYVKDTYIHIVKRGYCPRRTDVGYYPFFKWSPHRSPLCEYLLAARQGALGVTGTGPLAGRSSQSCSSRLAGG